MVAPKKRIKMFNRILSEFIEDYNKMYNLEIPFVKIKELSVLNTFKDEINYVSEDFFKCEQTAFKNITLCKQLQLDQREDLGENKLSIWKYLHNLYILTQEAPDKSDLVNKTKQALENVSSSLAVTTQDTDMAAIIQDIAGEVSQSLQGKDLSSINPMDLLSTLMSGNTNINGIDFGAILKNTTEKIQSKIQSGELDTDKLKKQADNLLKDNPMINELISSQMKKESP
jgi:hypothetical protein